MNLYHDFVQVSKLSENQKNETPPKMEHFFSPNSGEDKKKKVFTKNGTFFPPNSSEHLYAQMHTRVKLLGGDADVDYTQTIWGIQSNYWGVYPPGFRHPWAEQLVAMSFYEFICC